jgi:hypothetical protein
MEDDKWPRFLTRDIDRQLRLRLKFAERTIVGDAGDGRRLVPAAAVVVFGEGPVQQRMQTDAAERHRPVDGQ